MLQPRSVRVPPRLSGPADILMLQQTIGNRAVMRLLDKQQFVVQAKATDDSEEVSVQFRAVGQGEGIVHAAALGWRPRFCGFARNAAELYEEWKRAQKG